jgi:hypothetical protein
MYGSSSSTRYCGRRSSTAETASDLVESYCAGGMGELPSVDLDYELLSDIAEHLRARMCLGDFVDIE